MPHAEKQIRLQRLQLLAVNVFFFHFHGVPFRPAYNRLGSFVILNFAVLIQLFFHLQFPPAPVSASAGFLSEYKSMEK